MRIRALVPKALQAVGFALLPGAGSADHAQHLFDRDDDDAEVEVGHDFARAANEDRIAPVAVQMAEEPFDSGSFRITSLFGG